MLSCACLWVGTVTYQVELFQITTILHEPNEKVYLEFYVLVDGNVVNRTIVVETFKVSNVNLLTAKLGFQVIKSILSQQT